MQARNASAEDEPEHVDASTLAVRCLGDGDGGQDERDDAETEIEPEDRPPAREPDERASDDRPEGKGQARDGRPHAERVRPGLPVGVDVADDGERAWLAGGSPDAHDHAAGDQPVDVARQCGHHGSGAEDGDPRQHDALAPEDVTQHPRREHEAGEGQRVAVDHPLQRRDTRVEVALDVGQPYADDRVVEEGEEEDGAQGRERQGLGGRAQAPLLDLQAGSGAIAGAGPFGSLGQQGGPARRKRAPGCSSTQFMHRVLRTHEGGSGTPMGCPTSARQGNGRLWSAPLGLLSVLA